MLCSESFWLHFYYAAWNFGRRGQYPDSATKACSFVRDVTDKHLCASPPSSAVCFLRQEEVLVCGWEVSSFTPPQQSSLSDTYQPGAASLLALDVTLGKGHTTGAPSNWVISNYTYFLWGWSDKLWSFNLSTEQTYLSSLLRSTA